MDPIYIFTLFHESNGKPCCTGISVAGNITIKEMYRPGAGKLLIDVHNNIRFVRDLIASARQRNIPIVTSDFKSHLKAFDLPLTKDRYTVYDLHLPRIKPGGSPSEDAEKLDIILRRMPDKNVKPYQNIIANAAVVYQDLENTGLVYNYAKVRPKYSQNTYSGRSKTTGFNIQGLGEPSLIWPTGYDEGDVLLHFDWICADIRAASVLSNDQKLQEAFQHSDPYTHMMHEINDGSQQQITREESKIFLLKSINSMDYTSEALSDIYPGLGRWIHQVHKCLNHEGGHVQTILQRKFRADEAKNVLAALNAAMQGSVAHGMQAVIRQIWERYGARLITEIHDSLVVSCPPYADDIERTANAISNIMLRPFGNDGPAFPLNVSIGKKWKRWKKFRTYRDNHV